MNPYDLYALERVIELKKQTGSTVICLSMGAESSEALLTKALAMGVDEAILLTDQAYVGSDTVATAYILSRAIKKIGGVDMVICGDRSIDGETGQVVYGLSESLNYNGVSRIDSITSVARSWAVAEQRGDGEVRRIKIRLPAVVSFCEFQLGQPDISLLALKRAKRREITRWGFRDIGADTAKCGVEGSKTKVLDVKNSWVKKESICPGGTAFDKVSAVVDVILGREYKPGA